MADIDAPYIPPRAAAALRALRDERGLLMSEMASMGGLEDDRPLQDFLGGRVDYLPKTDVMKVAHALGIERLDVLYAEGERAAKENPYHPARAAAALRALLLQGHHTESSIARAAGITAQPLGRYLAGDWRQCSLKVVLKVAKALGANGFGELYRMGNAAEAELGGRPSDFALCAPAIQYLMDEKGLTCLTVAKKAGVDNGQLSAFIKNGTSFSGRSLQRVAEALDCRDIGELYREGERAAQCNPFIAERCIQAIRQLMTEQGLSARLLAERSGVNPGSLSTFLRSGKGLPLDGILAVAQELGADGFGTLYEMGGSPLPAWKPPAPATYNTLKATTAIQALREEHALSMQALANRAGVPYHALRGFLGNPQTYMPAEKVRRVSAALGAYGWDNLYYEGARAVRESPPIPPDLMASYGLAAFYLLQEKGLSTTQLSDMSGINDSQLWRLLHHEIVTSRKNVLKVAAALEVDGLDGLLREGERAAQQNPYIPERCAIAIRNIMTQRGLTILHVSEEMGDRPIPALQGFLKDKEGKAGQPGHLSIANVLEVAHRLGAPDFGTLYRMGGVPLAKPKNGIGHVLQSILDAGPGGSRPTGLQR